MKFESILGPCDSTTVGELVSRCASTANVFEQHGGNDIQSASLTLAQFATQFNIDEYELCRSLFDVYMAENPLEKMDSEELLAIIARDYETVHKEELPKLHRLARKIEAVHRDSPVLPKGITLLVKDLHQSVNEQISRENTTLSSMSAENVLKEHQEINEQLAKIRTLTERYNPPAEACRSWCRLYDELQELDVNMSEQMYLEREILLPRITA